MLRAREVVEYQITQLPNGVSVIVRSETDADLESLRASLEEFLRTVGLRDPEVVVRQVATMDRLWSGKLRRFVPLR